MPVTRQQQREKYETDTRYHAPADDFDSLYSLRSRHGLYFETRRLRAWLDLLNENRVRLASRRVLDVGCHHGLYANLFAYLRQDASGVSGCDYIDAYLETARRVNGSVHYRCQDLYDLTFEPNSFDLILLNYVLSCIPPEDAPTIVEKLTALLAPGGLFLFFDFFHSPAFRALARITGRDRDPLPAFDDERINRLFSECRIVSSTTLIPMMWHRMIRIGLPYFFLDLSEKLLIRRYYVALLEKRG